jgi:PrsW family intramembrane metalloprotease
MRALEAFVEAAQRGRPGASLATPPDPLDRGQALAGPEWWERLAARRAAWWRRHQRLARRAAVVATVALWVALAGLLVVFVLYPELRAGLRVWLWLYGLLVAWFAVARTRTVSWRLLAGVFATSVWWSVVIAVISMWLSGRAGGVRGDGPGTVIAGITEESLKLVPVVVLALLAPGRVRRLAVVDWLLLGFASGLGFQAFEELARRTSAVVRPGLLDVLDRLLGGNNPFGPGSGYPQYGWSLLAGGSGTALAGYAGHHVFTALVAATVGLGVAAWRRGARLAAGRPGAGRSWRVVAVAGPLAVWWLVVCDHAGFNATLRTGSRAWAQAGNMPRLLRVTWDLSRHGFGRGWLLLGLLLLALLVDARHLRRGEPTPPAADAPPAIADSPGLVADRWTTLLATWQEHNPAAPPPSAGLALATRWATGVVAAACALVAYTVQDLLVLLGAHARQPGEARLEAMARGRLAMGELHDQRATAIAAAAPPDTTRRRRLSRGVAVLGLAGLLAAGLLLAPALASQVGPSLTASFGWLAGALDALGSWWDSLGLGSQIAVGLGIAALIALSGGSLGLAFGASGAATYLLDHGHGLAAFSRDPAAATRRYLATTTPQGAIADLGEFALTFAPGNLAGAAGGRFTRQTVLRGIGPRVNLGRLAAGKSVILSDGTTMARLGDTEAATFGRWGDGLTWQPARGTGAARAYQVKVYGEHEPLVSRPGQPRTFADGLSRDYGSVGDAKFRDSASSFYDPDSLHPSVQQIAREKIDKLLLDYKRVLDDPGNPAQALELMTNDPRVARVFAQRMRALGVHGYVVINR